MNNCLYAGPPFGQKTFDILLWFRSHKTALAGDSEKAFLMVSVVEEDRDVLRFLGIDDPEQEKPDIVVLNQYAVSPGPGQGH